MVYKREKSANMLLKFVFVLLGVFWSIHSIAAERMQLTCDELGLHNTRPNHGLTIESQREYDGDDGDGSHEEAGMSQEDEQVSSEVGSVYSGIYCTVTNFRAEYTTQVDCDVYPLEREHVKVVRFSNSKMLYIPHGMFRYFSNIREFDISSSHIETIHRNFEGAKNLVFLIISQNNITELGASLFVDAPTLTVVDFSYNRINKINKFAFAEARSLSRLVLSHNDISELDERLFKDLRFLDQIFLDHNQIESLPVGLFASNVLLQKIILNNNRIATLPCSHYAGLKYLDTLQLADNRLTQFDPLCLDAKLDSLNLNGNNLTQLLVQNVIALQASNNSIREVIVLDDGATLEALYISNNSLLNIQNITNKLVNLETLDVSFNTVGKLNITTFAKLTKLTKLDLERTNITNLDFGTFANLHELVFLDVSYNNLNKFNWDILLPYLTKLEELFLNGNNLTAIEGSGHIVHNFPQLRILGIGNNNFNCTYLATFFRILNFSKIRTRFDTDSAATMDSAHVSGIACNSTQPQSVAHPVGHLEPAQKYEFELMKTKMEYFFKNDVHLMHKIDALQSKVFQQQVQHQHLAASITTVKYFVCLWAVAGFIFIVVKFVRVYVENRQLKINLHSSGGFPSTATMNTLQSSIPY